MKSFIVVAASVAIAMCVSYATADCITYLLPKPGSGSTGHNYDPDIDGYVECVIAKPEGINNDGSINWDAFEDALAQDLIKIHENLPTPIDPEIFRRAANYVVTSCRDDSSSSNSSDDVEDGKSCLKEKILSLFHHKGAKTRVIFVEYVA